VADAEIDAAKAAKNAAAATAAAEAAAEVAVKRRLEKLVREAERQLENLPIKSSLPLKGFLNLALGIVDDGQEAFSQGQHQQAYVYMTRYVKFASLLPNHADYARASADVAKERQQMEDECARVRNEALPSLTHELTTRFRDEERRKRHLPMSLRRQLTRRLTASVAAVGGGAVGESSGEQLSA